MHSQSGMRLGKILVVVASSAPIVAVTSMGCSDNGQSVFADLDAQVEGSPGDTGFFAADSGDGARDAPATCAPALPAGFAPAWKGPGVDTTKCLKTQLQGYADACLGQPYDPGKCDAFKQANAACAACLETDDTATAYGPIIWHSQRLFFTVNIAGCISIEQADPTGATCAAAYQADVVCKETACTSCFFIASPSFDTFAACEKTAGSSVCQTYAPPEATKCASAHAADAASTTCFPNASQGTVDLFLQIAPLFCGAK